MTKHLTLISVSLLLCATTGTGCLGGLLGGPFVPDFIDQDLAGQIGGDDWTYGVGAAVPRDGEYSIDLYTDSSDTPCTSTSFDQDIVMFSPPDAVGLYTLGLDSFGVTLVEDRGDDAPMNHISLTGAVEILEITYTEISGRMDVEASSDSWANGNFTAVICD